MEAVIYLCAWDGKNGSRTLLKHAVRDYAKVRDDDPNLLLIQTTENGKPYFPNLADVFVSVSHSAGYWACAAAGGTVGLDLQEDRPVRKKEVLAKRFFHPEEAAWLKKRPEQFCRVWAYKESYLKYLGTGLAGGMDQFSVIPALETGARVHDAAFTELSVLDGFYLVLAAKETAQLRVRNDFGSCGSESGQIVKP